jgi:hypothetical protein
LRDLRWLQRVALCHQSNHRRGGIMVKTIEHDGA